MDNQCRIEINPLEHDEKVGVQCTFTSATGRVISFSFDGSKDAGYFNIGIFARALIRSGDDLLMYAQQFEDEMVPENEDI